MLQQRHHVGLGHQLAEQNLTSLTSLISILSRQTQQSVTPVTPPSSSSNNNKSSPSDQLNHQLLKSFILISTDFHTLIEEEEHSSVANINRGILTEKSAEAVLISLNNLRENNWVLNEVEKKQGILPNNTTDAVAVIKRVLINIINQKIPLNQFSEEIIGKVLYDIYKTNSSSLDNIDITFAPILLNWVTKRLSDPVFSSSSSSAPKIKVIPLSTVEALLWFLPDSSPQTKLLRNYVNHMSSRPSKPSPSSPSSPSNPTPTSAETAVSNNKAVGLDTAAVSEAVTVGGLEQAALRQSQSSLSSADTTGGIENTDDMDVSSSPSDSSSDSSSEEQDRDRQSSQRGSGVTTDATDTTHEVLLKTALEKEINQETHDHAPISRDSASARVSEAPLDADTSDNTREPESSPEQSQDRENESESPKQSPKQKPNTGLWASVSRWWSGGK